MARAPHSPTLSLLHRAPSACTAHFAVSLRRHAIAKCEKSEALYWAPCLWCGGDNGQQCLELQKGRALHKQAARSSLQSMYLTGTTQQQLAPELAC